MRMILGADMRITYQTPSSFAEVHPGERPIATELNPKQALCLTEIALNDRF